jgi:hypothetical protein
MGFQTLERGGNVAVPARDRITAVCTGRAPKASHSSVWMVSSQTWGLRVTRYGGRHACHLQDQPRGCVAASQLRAVNALLAATPPGIGVDVQVTDSNVLALLQRWLGGDATPPDWYRSGGGTLTTLARRLVNAPPGLIVPVQVNVDDSPLVTTAYQLAEKARKAYDRQGEDGVLEEFDRDTQALLAGLAA